MGMGDQPEDLLTLLIVRGSLCVGAGSDPIWGTALSPKRSHQLIDRPCEAGARVHPTGQTHRGCLNQVSTAKL